MFFYTGDLHFGHENILSLCRRPFGSLEEMHETLIRNWNERVTGNDAVFILGDLFFGCEDPEPILRRLRGKKRLIVGNHDGAWMQKTDVEKHFFSVDELLEISDSKRGLTLCHYPLLTWKREEKTYMIHGHIHVNTDMDFWPCIRARDRLLNAGTDLNGFRPVSFEELLENNRRFKAKH